MVNKGEMQIHQVQEFTSIEKELDDLFKGIDQEREKNLKPYLKSKSCLWSFVS